MRTKQKTSQRVRQSVGVNMFTYNQYNDHSLSN